MTEGLYRDIRNYPFYRRLPAGLALALLLLLAPLALADEIPARVAVQAFIKPVDDELQVLIRIPMDATGEIAYPVRGNPGNLVISEAQPALEQAAEMYVLRAMSFYEDERLLTDVQLETARVSLPSNRDFETFDRALANVNSAPLSDSVNLYWRQGMLDILATYPIESENSRFSVDPVLGGLGIETTTALRYILPDGEERAFTYVGNPGLVYLDPRWHQAAFRFVKLGFDHILEGTDHLLFLFCLLIPLRNVRALIPVVTSFTIAHSITLIGSAFGVTPSVMWFPPLIETLIALSIVYMAFENIIGVNQKHRWVVTFGFGLVHGFGFSFLLSESMQFAGSHLIASLLAFNIGVELGQLLVLAVAVPLVALLFRYALPERVGVILLSALVAHSAWHWMTDRWANFSAYQLEWPALNSAFFVALMRWSMLLLIAAGALWLMYEIFNRFFAQDAQKTPAAEA